MRWVAVLGLLLAVAGVAVLSQMRKYQEPTELEDIFASLEKPVTEHAPLPRAMHFTSAEFTRPGLWRDSLVQKRHRLEAEKKKLEVSTHPLSAFLLSAMSSSQKVTLPLVCLLSSFTSHSQAEAFTDRCRAMR